MNDNTKLNARLDRPILLSDSGVIIYKIFNHQESRHMLVIDIGVETTIDQIKSGWYEIVKIREEFLSKYGMELTTLDDVLFEQLQLKNDWSWQKIADYLNYHALVLMQCHNNMEKDKSSKSLGWVCLYTYFLAFNFPEKEFQDRFDEAVDILIKGKLPWKIRNGPFTKAKVRSALDHFRVRIQNKKLLPSSHRIFPTNLQFEEFLLLSGGCYQQVNHLVQQFDPLFWNRNEKWISTRIEAIRDLVEQGASQTTSQGMRKT